MMTCSENPMRLVPLGVWTEDGANAVLDDRFCDRLLDFACDLDHVGVVVGVEGDGDGFIISIIIHAIFTLC